MLKKPSDKSLHPRRIVTEDEADMLANKLADKPYGDDERAQAVQEKQARTTISLPDQLLRQCEDLAISNKRGNNGPKSVSALVRAALENYLKSSV